MKSLKEMFNFIHLINDVRSVSLIQEHEYVVGCFVEDGISGCASYSSGGSGVNEDNRHVAEAITHAQEAANHRGMAQVDAVVIHAEVSL